MNAVAVQPKFSQPFDLAEGTPKRLEQLAHASEFTSSVMLQMLVTLAHDTIALELPLDGHPFAAAFTRRLRELAAQVNHPSRGQRTSFRLDDEDMLAIRKLRDVLELPRRDLVLEYAVQAAWDTMPPPSGGDDPLSRKRRLARFHNVDGSSTAATDGGRLLFFTPASQLRLRGLEVPLKPKKR